MASIRKRGSSYLIVVSMGYDYNGKRIKPQQKTVHPPEELTPKQVEKWLNEQAVLFERECRHTPQPVQQLTLAKYIDLWLTDIAPGKLAKSTIRRDRQDIERILPALGHYKLTELRPEHFRNFYAELRKVIRPDTKKPLSEYTIEGVHATLCSILSDAVEGGFLSHNPAWRTYRYAGRKCEKKIADEETAQKIIAALEGESIKYETYFKLIIATGMRRGECCGLKWCDIDWEQRSIHICRNAVKVTDEEIFVKEPKTRAGNRYAYFSAEMEKNLDKVESGKADWHKTVDDFYQGFAASLEQAEKNMEGKKVKVPDEPSSEVCDLCGRPMVIKVGKYGKFLACSGFPECRGTKRLVKDTGGICPKCGKGRMLERKSAKGRIYYGCERYPDCDFMTWDTPVPTKCEKCGSTLFRKGSKLYCAKEGCGFEMPVPKKE